MRTIPSMVDLKRTPAEKAEEADEGYAFPSPINVPDYPYGLSISFDEDVMEKIGMEIGDVEVGDIIHLHAFATITSVSQRTDNDKTCCRVEAQITHISSEDEDTENEMDDEREVVPVKAKKAKMYREG